MYRVRTRALTCNYGCLAIRYTVLAIYKIKILGARNDKKCESKRQSDDDDDDDVSRPRASTKKTLYPKTGVGLATARHRCCCREKTASTTASTTCANQPKTRPSKKGGVGLKKRQKYNVKTTKRAHGVISDFVSFWPKTAWDRNVL